MLELDPETLTPPYSIVMNEGSPVIPPFLCIAACLHSKDVMLQRCCVAAGEFSDGYQGTSRGEDETSRPLQRSNENTPALVTLLCTRATCK